MGSKPTPTSKLPISQIITPIAYQTSHEAASLNINRSIEEQENFGNSD